MLTQQQLGKKIKEMRENQKLSQEKLAKLIGISRAALSELERGNRYLDAIELLNLSKIFSIDPVNFFNKEKEPVKLKRNNIKKFKVDKEKFKNVILYILEKCGGKPNVGETVLYKLLYFCDFDSYEITNKPITGMNYIKLQFGPVPIAKEYNPIISEMIENKDLKIITQDYHGMIQKRYIALKDSGAISEQEKNIINEIILKYSDMNARSIESFAHGDAPWKLCENQEIIDYNLVFNRVPPYAHRDYEAEFMQEGANDILSNLGSISDEEYDYYEKL